MTAQVPLRVAVVGPPLSASGGIGRVMSYALDAFPPGAVRLRVLDTRGLGSHPWLSVFPLLWSCVTLLWLGARHKLDLVHVNISSHGSALRKGVIVRVCGLVEIPVVLHLHASSFPEFYTSIPGWLQRWVRRTFGLADRVIVLAEVWRGYVQDVLAVSPQHVVVLPNATPGAGSRTSTRVAGEQLHIVFLGRLGSRKGVPELLEALGDRRLQRCEWRATLAGDGDIDTYRRRAAEFGLDDRTQFTGWISTDKVTALLAESHVLVLPSHAEGSPMSVLEAFAAGVPVVCTPVGGLVEVVVDGANGLIVPEGAAAPLADALLQLLQDEDLRERLSVGALSTWRRDHTIEGYVGRLTHEWRRTASAGALSSDDAVQWSAVRDR